MSNDFAMKTVPWDENTYKLGVGVDYVTGQARASILEGSFSKSPGAGGSSQDVSSVLLRIETKEDLVNILSVELTGSASASTPEGGGSASFFGKFVEQVKINTYNLYFVLIVQVVNSVEQIEGATVNKALGAALPPNFAQKYGDHLLAGVKTGGLYMAVVEIVTKTEEKKQEVMTKLGLGLSGPSAPIPGGLPKKGEKTDEDKTKAPVDDGGTAETVDKEGIQATGSLKETISKVRTVVGTELRARVRRIGGVGPVENDDPDRMTKEARQFPEMAAKNGAPICAILKPYSQVDGLPDFKIDHDFASQYVICRDRLSRCLMRAQFILDNFDYALDPSYREHFAGHEALVKSRADVAAHIGKVNALLLELERDPRKFLSGEGYAERLPPLLSLQSIPRRLRQKRTLTPGVVDHPRNLARLVESLVLDDDAKRLSPEARAALARLGSFVAEVFVEVWNGLRQIPWGFQENDPKRLEIAVKKVAATEKKLTERLRSELPDLVTDVTRKLGSPDDGGRPSNQINDANTLVSRLTSDAHGRGGLAEHMSPLKAAVDEIKAIMPLLGEAKLSDVVVCDEEAWNDRREQYEVAIRILGRAVHLELEQGGREH